MANVQRFVLVTLVSLALLVFHLPSAWTSPVPNACAEDGKLGAVASENAICSRHGTEILEAGGNAADAVSDNAFSSSLLNIESNCDPDGRNGVVRRYHW